MLSRQTLLIDADDTLWENTVLFEKVISDYLDWLAHPTLDRTEIRRVLDDIERANIVTRGFGSAAFLANLAESFQALHQRPVTDVEQQQITGLAQALLEHRIELLPGVADTLTTLAGRHDLRLVTKGERSEQQRKLDASGLAEHFASVHIVANKTPAVYRTLLQELSLEPASTWMIGNSPASDILPARAVGMRAVHVPHPDTWVLERADLDPTDDGVLTVAAFGDLLRHF